MRERYEMPDLEGFGELRHIYLSADPQILFWPIPQDLLNKGVKVRTFQIRRWIRRPIGTETVGLVALLEELL